MAAAEARAAWQRTANRCFVQEDAKRAPKLACCQSSSTSKPVDAGSGNSADVYENPVAGFMHMKRSTSSANLPPDVRWWLKMQPDYGHQRGLTNEQLSGLDIETESFISVGGEYSSDMLNVVEPFKSEPNMKRSFESGSSTSMGYARVSTTIVEKEMEVKLQDLRTMHCEVSPELSDMSSYYEVLGVDSHSNSAGKRKMHEPGLDYESSSIGTTGSWWRTADGDELASLVSQKSIDHFENCDLPPPQNLIRSWKPAGRFGLSDPPIQAIKSIGMSTPHSVQEASVEHSKLSSNSKSSSSTVQDDLQNTLQQMSLADPSKAQLLEALCHSQTRAREAEKAAEQASLEKENIMKLFFRQASHLFAYKQWFKILQLEAFYFQLKNKDQPLSSLFPSVLPWTTPRKARKLKRNLKKIHGKSSKPRHSRFSMWKYGLAMALGLGLVGAGLLIGWSVGCLFPVI